MIPKRLFWALDASALYVAFGATYMLIPAIRLWLVDSAWLSATGLAERLSVPRGDLVEPFPPPATFLWMLLIMIPAVIVFMEAVDGYRPLTKQSVLRIADKSFMAGLFGLGLVALVPFALRDPRWSRLFVIVFFISGVMALAGYRILFRWYRLKRIAAGYHSRRIAFIGSTRSIEHLLKHLSTRVVPAEFQVAGFLRLDPTQEPPRLPAGTLGPSGNPVLSVLGDAHSLADVFVLCPIDEVIAIQDFSHVDLLKQVMEACDYFHVTLRIVPEPLLSGSRRDLELLYHADPLQLPQIVLKPPHLDSDALFVKRLIDIFVSTALLVLLTPLFLVIALAIKLTTPGLPVFYRWRVVGYQGRPFTGYKFTTMASDADEQMKHLLDQNEMSGPVFKIKGDPRVTPLGRVLRKYSLNELPQLWSVLKGDMSLVGPRPAFPHELQRYELWHKRKLCVKPGITCLWQVRGRNRISSFDEWVRMDLEYIDNWSLWLDLRILVRTGWVVVAGSGY